MMHGQCKARSMVTFPHMPMSSRSIYLALANDGDALQIGRKVTMCLMESNGSLPVSL